jgi:hypothetical protein
MIARGSMYFFHFMLLFAQEYERYENFVRHIEYLKNRYPNTKNDEIFATLLESGADMSFEEICMRDGTCNIPCEENCPEFEPLVLNYEDVPEQKDWRDTVSNGITFYQYLSVNIMLT